MFKLGAIKFGITFFYFKLFTTVYEYLSHVFLFSTCFTLNLSFFFFFGIVNKLINVQFKLIILALFHFLIGSKKKYMLSLERQLIELNVLPGSLC